MRIIIPDSTNIDDVLFRTTHLAVSAHPDDIEFMAYDGILKCYESRDMFFTAVIAGDGAGSPRSGKYAGYSDEQMREVRADEQLSAAKLGKYNAVIFLDKPSSEIKDSDNPGIVEELTDIIRRTRPNVVYTHNPADKHDTHVATMMRVIKALRCAEYVPDYVYGCEVWRSLDWLCDYDKISLDVSGNPSLESEIMEAFDSQIAGGKRYDHAVIGRRCANATFSNPHEVDGADGVSFALDLKPLVLDCTLSAADYIDGYIKRFSEDVRARITRYE